MVRFGLQLVSIPSCYIPGRLEHWDVPLGAFTCFNFHSTLLSRKVQNQGSKVEEDIDSIGIYNSRSIRGPAMARISESFLFRLMSKWLPCVRKESNRPTPPLGCIIHSVSHTYPYLLHSPYSMATVLVTSYNLFPSSRHPAVASTSGAFPQSITFFSQTRTDQQWTACCSGR
jgi:hypothetical protein